ncbi:MAG: prohibitin family protein [Spirochaetota bacterium]
MLVFGILFILAGVGVIIIGGRIAASSGKAAHRVAALGGGGGGAFLGLIFVIASMAYVVEPGEVGVEVLFGSVQRYTENGLHFKNPLAGVIVFDVKTRREEQKSEGASQDLQLVTVEAIVNYRLEASRIPDLYSKVGSDYAHKVLIPAIQEGVKAATARYKVEEIIVKRHQLKEEIIATLKSKLSNYYMILEDVNIQDIDFSPEFNKVVEEKQIEEQKIKTAEYRRQQAEQDKQRVILEGQAEAEKQRLLKISTSREVVDLKWIEKWNGVLPQTMMGNNAVPMVQLAK